MTSKTYTITGPRLASLLKAEAKLDALEAYGVDNWSGYGDALGEEGEDFDDYFTTAENIDADMLAGTLKP